MLQKKKKKPVIAQVRLWMAAGGWGLLLERLWFLFVCMFVYICVYFCLCVYFCPTFPSLKLYSNPDQGLRRYSAKSSIISSLQKIAKTGSGSQTETHKHTRRTHTATQRPPHSHGLKINSYKHACIFFFLLAQADTHANTNECSN